MKKKTTRTKKRESRKPTVKPFCFKIILSSNDNKRSEWIKIANETLNLGKEKIRDFEYHFYYFGGDDLRAYPIAKGSEGSEDLIPYEGLKKIDPSIEFLNVEDVPQICGSGLKNSWEIFYKHWSLGNFISYLSGESYFLVNQDRKIEEILKLRTREEEQKERFEAIINNRPVPKILDSDRHFERLFSDYPTDSEATILKMIADDPMLLHNTKIMNKFRDILVPMLTKARRATDREKRELVKDLLRKYLIPKHTGGITPLVKGVNYGLAVELMKSFAEYLSERCNDYQVDMEMDSKIGKKAYTDLNLLKDWAWQNREEKSDADIAAMDIDDLELLIEFPRKFIPRFIKAHLKVDPKTLSQFLKSS